MSQKASLAKASKKQPVNRLTPKVQGLSKLDRNLQTQIYIDPEFLFFNFQIHSISDTLLELRQYNIPDSQAPPEERFILRR